MAERIILLHLCTFFPIQLFVTLGFKSGDQFVSLLLGEGILDEERVAVVPLPPDFEASLERYVKLFFSRRGAVSYDVAHAKVHSRMIRTQAGGLDGFMIKGLLDAGSLRSLTAAGRLTFAEPSRCGWCNRSRPKPESPDREDPKGEPSGCLVPTAALYI